MSDLLDMIHSNVCGPMSTSARYGLRYFILFTDNYSHYGYICLMGNRNEFFDKFKEFEDEVVNRLNKNIESLRKVRRGECLGYLI